MQKLLNTLSVQFPRYKFSFAPFFLVKYVILIFTFQTSSFTSILLLVKFEEVRLLYEVKFDLTCCEIIVCET